MIWKINYNTQSKYIQAIQNALISSEEFDKFRSQTDYNAIVCDGMPSHEKIIYTNELFKYNETKELIEKIKVMDNIGRQEPKPSDRNLRYLYNALRIKYNLNKNIQNVVEIGVGYGGMCFTMGNVFNIQNYHLVDIPCVIDLTKIFLSKLPKVIDSFEPKSKYDLCISECALSELDQTEIEKYYQQYLIHSKYLFIRTNFNRSVYTLNDFIELIKSNFTIKLIQDFPHPQEPKTVMFGYNNDFK